MSCNKRPSNDRALRLRCRQRQRTGGATVCSSVCHGDEEALLRGRPPAFQGHEKAPAGPLAESSSGSLVTFTTLIYFCAELTE